MPPRPSSRRCVKQWATDIELMIEFHGRLGAGAAAAMIRRLERFRPAWCEEPVAPECLELLAEVKRSAGCPIAAGERLYTQADFYRLTALRAVDVVQMDLAHCGGILAGKKIAAMAAPQDILVAPHCSIGPVALAACLHFDVSHAQLPHPGNLRRVRRPVAQRPGRAAGIPSGMASSSWAMRPDSAWSWTSRPSPIIPMWPMPSPACGTATGRRISPRIGEVDWKGAEEKLVRIFRIAMTGDFLDESGAVAYGDAGLARLERCPYVRWHFVTGLAPKPGDPAYWSRLYSLEVAPEQIRDVDGLVVLRPWLKRSTFAAGAGDLVVIGRSGAGYDKIDLAACTEHGVAVFNAPMALNHSTASSALLFMLALAKRLPDQERVVRQGRWDLQPSVMGGEIQGRTLGIVGLGHSGRELVRLVGPFEMRIVAYSPHADPAVARELGVELTSLEEVLRQSDFVSLHCRLTESTRGLIGAEQLAIYEGERLLHQRRPGRAGRSGGAGGRAA